VILPILEELATLSKQAKEISCKLIRTEANDAETASKVQDKFYCINSALSSAEKLIWSSVIESAGLAEKADGLILGMRNKICKFYARF
jgi:hypothetical protein